MCRSKGSENRLQRCRCLPTGALTDDVGEVQQFWGTPDSARLLASNPELDAGIIAYVNFLGSIPVGRVLHIKEQAPVPTVHRHLAALRRQSTSYPKDCAFELRSKFRLVPAPRT